MKLTEQQLNRAIYSLWDFQQALSALTFLLEECDFNEKHHYIELRKFRCYESTLIIAMARPLETTKKGSTLGLRALGIKLSPEQNKLVDRILELRRKIVAHSDEEEMHFRVTTFPVDEFNFPQFKFNEGLHLGEEELRKYEEFLRELTSRMNDFFFDVAQKKPELLKKYQEPLSFKSSKEGDS